MKTKEIYTWKRISLFRLICLALILIGLAACGGAPETAAPAAGGDVRPTPPAEYADKKNPQAGKADAIEVGKSIYNINCASCHGEKALGDGPAAASLNPKPKSLAEDGALSDAYLYWRIAEGGMMEPFRSTMPAWKTFLSEEQIWQVVAYLRTLMR